MIEYLPDRTTEAVTTIATASVLHMRSSGNYLHVHYWDAEHQQVSEADVWASIPMMLAIPDTFTQIDRNKLVPTTFLKKITKRGVRFTAVVAPQFEGYEGGEIVLKMSRKPYYRLRPVYGR